MKITISEKKRLIALLLVLFLGGFGIHRMYVGKVGTGIVQLILTLSLLGIFVSSVWVFINLIPIATENFRDKDGAIVKRWE